MSLDGAMLSQICHEITSAAPLARVDKIAQPSRDEIILHIRSQGENRKLLINAGASNARMQFTTNAPENPQTPPMFCMLLRKRLSGAKLLSVEQYELDRIVRLSFETQNDFGDLVQLQLIVEIMGKHSNIVLLSPEEKVIDSIHRVDYTTSSVRQILPGILYCLPPLQEKQNLKTADILQIITQLRTSEQEVSKALLGVLQGFSPLSCREIAFRAGVLDIVAADLSAEQWKLLIYELDAMQKLLLNNSGTPTMLLEPDGRPKDFTFLPALQYVNAFEIEMFTTYSALLDHFYLRRSTTERIRQRSSDLLHHVESIEKRIARRIGAQMEELEECAHREELRIQGDLLTANLHQLQKGDSIAVVTNYYDPDEKTVSIPLDVRKTPAQNAQRYYGQYRKLDTAEKILTQRIAEGQEELEYIRSILDSLQRAENEADLDAIRLELADSGYVRRIANLKQKKMQKLPPHSFYSSDGFTIYAGRNNLQNDQLTLKDSRSDDIWLHTQKIPGSHTIIVAEGREVPETTLLEAAAIAAYYSEAQNSSKVPVDYALIRHVKKPAKAKPGRVIYDHFHTILVEPNEQLVLSLKKQL